MPLSSSSRTVQKTENAVSDYLDLHLHSAAAKGNLALVHYALNHGQPVNSVLEGLQPLHAAASNGSEPVVARILDAGADVNAPRLALRNHSEKGKGSQGIGTTGCTPLHFAAANGHLAIVKMLLARGADPLRADRYGVRPEDIAAEYGFQAIVQVLREAGDSYEQPPSSPSASSSSKPPPPPPPNSTSPSHSRILRVQRSINGSLSTSRRPSFTSSRSSRNNSSDSAAERPHIIAPIQEAAQAGYSPLTERRPSLPTLALTGVPSSSSSSRATRVKRPSSAGEGASRIDGSSGSGPGSGGTDVVLDGTNAGSRPPPRERAGHQKTSSDPGEEASPPIRTIRSKYSLANLFKRNPAEPSSTSDQQPKPRSSSEHSSSGSSRDPALAMAKTLTDVFGAPLLPPKAAPRVRYRSRKSSEVVVSSPLASGSTTARDGSPDREPGASSSASEAATTSNGRLRSSSAPVTELGLSQRHRQPPSMSPRTSEDATATPMARVGISGPVEWGEKAPPPQLASCLSIPCAGGPPDDQAVAEPPLLNRSTSDPVPTVLALLQPSAANTARDRGNSLSSNSEASSGNERGSSATSSTMNTSVTPPSPDAKAVVSGTSSRRGSLSSRRPPPLTLHGVTSRSEAAALVESTRRGIVDAAFSTSENGGVEMTLAERLELHGRALQLEKHFARGEAQKHGRRALRHQPSNPTLVESDGEEVVGPERSRETSSPSSSDLTASPMPGPGPSSSAIALPSTSSRTRLPREAVVRSASTSMAAPTTTKGHRPIANMSFLHHKQSLEARLNRQYQVVNGMIDDFDVEAEDADAYPADEFGTIQDPMRPSRVDSRKRRSSNIEIIHTLPTPSASPSSTPSRSALTTVNSEPLFKPREGSPEYRSPLANADAPPLPRGPRVPPENPFSPDYIPPSENAFPPRVPLGLPSASSAPPSAQQRPIVKRPSIPAIVVLEQMTALSKTTSVDHDAASQPRSRSPPGRISEDGLSGASAPLGASGTTSGKRFGLKSLVSTLTKR